MKPHNLWYPDCSIGIGFSKLKRNSYWSIVFITSNKSFKDSQIYDKYIKLQYLAYLVSINKCYHLNIRYEYSTGQIL